MCIRDRYDVVHQCAMDLTITDVQELSWERQVGFLHLFEQTIKLIGFGATSHVGVLLRVVLTMLSGSQSSLWRKMAVDAAAVDVHDEAEALDADEDEEQEDDDDMNERGGDDDVAASGDVSESAGDEKKGAHLRHSNQASKVRNLALLRLSEAIHQYHGTFEFSSLRNELLDPLRPLIAALPGAVISSSKPPALLKFLHAIVYYPATAGMVVPVWNNASEGSATTITTIVPQNKKKQQKTNAMNTAGPVVTNKSGGSSGGETDEYGLFIVKTLIMCVASRTNHDVSQMVKNILTSLLIPSSQTLTIKIHASHNF